MLYSATTNGFYLKNVHKEIPKDVKEITKDDHSLLLKEQSEGRVICADQNGYPVTKISKFHESDGSLTEENLVLKNNEVVERERIVLKSELEELDKVSIRDIRELLCESFPDNPIIEKLIGYEAEAKIKRDKLK